MKHKAQSFMDYAALIAIICVSLLVMSNYVYRSIDSRVAHIWADFYDLQTGIK